MSATICFGHEPKSSRAANRLCSHRRRIAYAIEALCIGLLLLMGGAEAGPLSVGGYRELTQRAEANAQQFFVYQTMDSAFNHGFPSQLYGPDPPTINAACVDDTSAVDGCSTNATSLDPSGNRLALDFSAVATGGSNAYGGLNIVEPQNYSSSVTSNGYDVVPATQILFNARSPTGITLQFGAGGPTTNFVTLAASDYYQSVCIALQGLDTSVCPASTNIKLTLPTLIDLAAAHILFTAGTSHAMSPNGGIILLHNIQYVAVPTRQKTVQNLPLSTQTFGIIPVGQIQSGPVQIPPDQVNRNLAALYELSLTVLALLARGTPGDMHNAFAIADSLVYALSHDNQGDPLPPVTGGGLHNGYEAGDLPLLNAQGSGPGTAQAGQVRLAGFSGSQALCGSTNYCLVLDGATGGNNAFAVLALLQAYNKSKKAGYLNAAMRIGNWIDGQLRDRSGTGFGGYFVGYPDGGAKKVLEQGKSTENNADIFAAFSALAAAETALGDASAAAKWTARAKIAGTFVIKMFDTSSGCFNAGTVPAGTLPSAGIDPTGPSRGMDVTNVFNFLDSNSFTYLALSHSPQYENAINWSRVPACFGQFSQTVQTSQAMFHGYDIVQTATAGPKGISWEFTGQAAVVTEISGGNATAIVNDMHKAQTLAPYRDGSGLVAATLQDGDSLPPYRQCLDTPFQCIPERVGIAATAWGIFAETRYNPL